MHFFLFYNLFHLVFIGPIVAIFHLVNHLRFTDHEVPSNYLIYSYKYIILYLISGMPLFFKYYVKIWWNVVIMELCIVELRYSKFEFSTQHSWLQHYAIQTMYGCFEIYQINYQSYLSYILLKSHHSGFRNILFTYLANFSNKLFSVLWCFCQHHKKQFFMLS